MSWWCKEPGHQQVWYRTICLICPKYSSFSTKRCDNSWLAQGEHDTITSLLLEWEHSKFRQPLNTLRPRQNGRHFPDDIFDYIFLNANVRILLAISLKFVPRGPILYILALFQIMAWRRPGDKPLSEPMMIILQTHICVTLPQWVNALRSRQNGYHFPDIIFNCLFWNENVGISLIMAWCLIGNKPLSVPMITLVNDAYMRHSASMS